MENPDNDTSELEFHQECYNQYTHKKTLLNLKEKNEASEAEDNLSEDSEREIERKRTSQRKKNRTSKLQKRYKMNYIIFVYYIINCIENKNLHNLPLINLFLLFNQVKW